MTMLSEHYAPGDSASTAVGTPNPTRPASPTSPKTQLGFAHSRRPSAAPSLTLTCVDLNDDSTDRDPELGLKPSEQRSEIAEHDRRDSAATAVGDYASEKPSTKTVDVIEEEGGASDPMQMTRAWWHPVSLLWSALDNWFLICLGVLVVLAWRFPDVGRNGGYLRSEYTIKYGAIALIFLITGLTLSTRALITQFKAWYSHLLTQAFSLLFFPAVVFAIVNIIKAAGNPEIDPYILVGLMMMAVLPTTVAANVTMTREANGNEEAAIAECCIGQVLGIFLSPLFLQMFMSAPGWEFGQPVAEGGKSSTDGLKQIYKQVGQHMGLAIFLPMIVGQMIQNVFPKPTRYVATTFRLPKVGSFLLLILIWSIFSNQFAQDAFNLVPSQSIILVVFLNLVLYLMFTGICLVLTRLPFLPANPVLLRATSHGAKPAKIPKWRKAAAGARFGKAEVTAICFCAAAKGLVVGSPILDILYAGMPPQQRAIISIPLVLYQGEQIAIGQLLTYLFRKWNEKPDPLKPE